MENEQKKVVILLSKDKLKAASVILDKKPAVDDLLELEWNKETLNEAFEKIKNHYQTSSVSIALDDEVGFYMDLNIPKGIENERVFISLKIAEKIPEIINSSDWDFKEVGQTKNEKQIKVFVPEKEIQDNIANSSNISGLIIEAIEPVSLSEKRNSDPFIGLALRKDVKVEKEVKVEEEVKLTEELLEEKKEEETASTVKEIFEEKKSEEATVIVSEEPQPEPVEAVKRKGNGKTIGTIALIVFVLGAVSFGGMFFYKRSLSLKSSAQSSGTPTIIQATPTPVLVLVKKEELIIEILNGGGIAGEGKRAKEYLEKLGYVVLNTGNADNFDYLETQISIKDDKKGNLEEIKKDLSSKYQVSENIISLASDNKYDVIITLGKK